MVFLSQEFHQLVALSADGLVGDVVGEVVDAVQLLGSLVQLFRCVILQLF